jgi:hypothetical protein
MATTDDSEILDFYRRPGEMSSAGKHAGLLGGHGCDLEVLAREAQGLILHEHIAGAYGETISDTRRNEVHIRTLENIIDRVLSHDPRPLTEPRSLGNRVIGNCRDYTLLTVALLRERGVPARGRCGFGAYFSPGKFVDHWVAEFWSEDQSRWVRMDAQIDDVQKRLFNIGFDLLDVPADQFLIAGDAWSRCRSGELDPGDFGILDMAGLWFIAGNLIRDVASLNSKEMLPWDAWGGMPQPGDHLDVAQLAFFDRLASLTQDPDAHFAEIRALYEGDERLLVPNVVFNAVRRRPELVATGEPVGAA